MYGIALQADHFIFLIILHFVPSNYTFDYITKSPMTTEYLSDRYTDYSLEPFFDLSADLLCIAGFDGYFKDINPSVSRLLKYSKDELLSCPINHFIHPEDREVTSMYRDKIRQGIPLLNFENRYVAKDGDIVWLSWTSMPLNDQELVYAIAKNITHKKKKEAERNNILSELTKTNNRLKQLNYSTAHDLRSPASSLLCVFDLIDLSKINDDKTVEFIGLLKLATESLQRTLNSYIEDLDRGEQPVNIEKLYIVEVLEDVKKSIHSLIQDSKVTFHTEWDGFTTLQANQPCLESILLNLITNSIKYAHPDRLPEIIIKTKLINGCKTLTFSDNGLGFDSDLQQDRIFGLNQTFHDHSDSNGIGLYLLYNHVINLGGKISVSSTVNVGTTFTITFLN